MLDACCLILGVAAVLLAIFRAPDADAKGRWRDGDL